MLSLNKSRKAGFLILPFIPFVAIALGIASGQMSSSPGLLIGGLGAVPIGMSLLLNFEVTLIGLLVIRSSLDPFSAQQLPAVFAIGVDLIAIAHICWLLLTKKPIKADGLLLFFIAWIALQAVWLVLMPLGGLGPSSLSLAGALREWVRMGSWMLVYFLVSQLQGKIRPEKIINWLSFSLMTPVLAAFMQMFLPASLLPSFLGAANPTLGVDVESRINGTLGHPSTFSSFLVLFIAITLWQFLESNRHRNLWLTLLLVLVFLLVSTKALTGLLMFSVFLFIFILPRLNIKTALGSIALMLLLGALFTSTEFGRERLGSIAETPLLNPDITLSRATMMGQWDGNSFNWRITQWTFLLQAWQKYPLLGYGIGSSKYLTVFQNYAHNDYVRALAEGGIVGFSLFITFLSGVAFQLWQISQNSNLPSKQRSLAFLLVSVLSSCAAGMLTDNIWNHTTLLFYFWLMVSVAGWDWSATSSHSQPSLSPPSDRSSIYRPNST